jgi:hypothetical protein
MASEIVGEHRTGSAGIQQDGDRSLSFSSSITFLVVTSDKSVTREEVLLLTPGLPVVGVSYGAIQAICKSKKATRRAENPIYWDVVCEFETGSEKQRQNPTNISDDPTTWIPVFRVDSFLTKERVLTTDKTPASAGNVNFGTTGPYKITNSAKQPFEDPLTETVQLCQFSFEQFEDPSQDLNDIMDRNDTVNSTTFAGRSARTLLCNVTGAELGSYGGYPAWRITYQMTYDRDTHDEKRLDVGTCYMKGGTYLSAGVQAPYTESTNNVQIVGNLDGTGGKSALPAVLTFRTKTELDFATFIRT